jgi:hypothetical protein
MAHIPHSFIYQENSTATKLENQGFQLIARYREYLLILDERFDDPYVLVNDQSGQFLTYHDSIMSVENYTKSNRSDWMIHNKYYWLSAGWARYDMKSDWFDGSQIGFEVDRNNSYFSDEAIANKSHLYLEAISNIYLDKNSITQILNHKGHSVKQTEITAINPAIESINCSWNVTTVDNQYIVTKQEWEEFQEERMKQSRHLELLRDHPSEVD